MCVQRGHLDRNWVSVLSRGRHFLFTTRLRDDKGDERLQQHAMWTCNGCTDTISSRARQTVLPDERQLVSRLRPVCATALVLLMALPGILVSAGESGIL